MTSRRFIGRWALVGLMVNSMIGSGIFGVPGELARILGPASPLACVAAGIVMGVVILCFVEVGSQFSASGGPYLYVRTAFGRLLGIQIGWFTALTPLAAAAAQANLFSSYLAGFFPAAGTGLFRSLTIVGVVGIPVTANLYRAQAGKVLSSLLVVAKLVPLALLIGAGLLSSHAQPAVPVAATDAAAVTTWLGAVLIAIFSFGGFEDALAASGEVEEPRRAVPFALVVSLLVCIVVNVLIQTVTAAALAGKPLSDRPLAAVASVLLGPPGANVIAVAALISISGAISATVLAVPRLLAALGAHGDLPAAFARVEQRGTPVMATLVVAAVVIVLSLSGSFRLALAVTTGSMAVFAGAVCAAVPRLRRLQSSAIGVRIPGGTGFAALGVMFSIALLSQLEAREAAAIAITSAIAFGNWLILVKRQPKVG